ncbi:acyl-CoA dehydrogenase [Novosphingobium sp. 9U]|uniref:acyl-CoA dehydrogenase n=1 Tax=Novosphingobium sp. 9U TaxID=2653158 RepID=UPI001359C74A|nr:acyl-CoA dehydrogenase family protein [Novosphingobium sp. 9U]
MDLFERTEEQDLLAAMLGRFLGDTTSPGQPWAGDFWRALGSELGVLAAPFPEPLGGTGGGMFDAAIVLEKLGEHGLATPYLDTVVMAGRALLRADENRHDNLLLAIGKGDEIVAVAHDERGLRGRAGPLRTVAQADDAGWRLTGLKCGVRFAPIARYLLVSAHSEDSDGPGLFLVPADRAGVTLSSYDAIDGAPCADVLLDGVHLGREDRIASNAAALSALLLDGEAGRCCESLGLMRAMLRTTADYARQRKQFGKRLADFQVLRHRLVDLYIALEQAEALTEAAVQGLARDLDRRPLLVAAARYSASTELNRVARDAVQIHGAVGMMIETPVARLFRRATVLQREGRDSQGSLSEVALCVGATLPDTHHDLLGRLQAVNAGAEALRAEVRAFLAKELTSELAWQADLETGAFSPPHVSTAWQRRLATKGWVAPGWPKEQGGTGWSPRERQAFEQEMALAGAPRLPAMGLQMLAPVLMRFGTAEQKARFLPRILTGDDFWCQGYSEPGAGSDLAGLQLRAARDGEHYRLNGSKIWTTFAQFANWIFVLARTDTQAARHRGISFLLVPLDSPGIEVRPIISISGDHEVNQVFFDDVLVPVTNLVGDENEGWEVAMYLLEHERGVGHQVPTLVRELARLRSIAESQPNASDGSMWDDPLFRTSFAQLEVRCLAIRLIEVHRVYSPARVAASQEMTASVLKLLWSEAGQEVDELVMQTLGSFAVVDLPDHFRDDEVITRDTNHKALSSTRRYLNNRVLTIAGGSSEIQRTVLARHILDIG